MSNEFTVEITLNSEIFQVKVFENPDMYEYIPFNIVEHNGCYVSEVREKVDLIIKDIVVNCFENINIISDLLEYVKEKYGTKPKKPWNDDSITLNTAFKGKWYGLFLNIPYKSISVNSENSVDILNVKVKPEKIEKLIDKVNYFPAYHMNKKHWITIVLDKNVNIDFIKKLLDDSYNLVENS